MIYNDISKKLIYIVCAIAALIIITFSLINTIIAYNIELQGGESNSIFNGFQNNYKFYEDTIDEDSIMKDVVSRNK